MKIEATIAVLRNTETGEVIDAQSINDMYDEIGFEYPREFFTKVELEDFLIKVWGKERYITNGAPQLQSYASKGYVKFQSEAKSLPAIGKLRVDIVTQEIDVK